MPPVPPKVTISPVPNILIFTYYLGFPKFKHILKVGLHILKEGLHILKEGFHILKEGLHILIDGLHILKEDLHIFSSDPTTQSFIIIINYKA
jgi:hypothetical protein